MRVFDGRTFSRLGPRQLVILLVFPLVAACSAPAAQLTYLDLHATAVVSGCWPGNAPTPNPITVTPRVSTPTARGAQTPLPTTTPLPRCTPMPGAPTLAPYPTAISTPVPYPTQRPIIVNGGKAFVTVLELPFIHHVVIAAIPSESWVDEVLVWLDELIVRDDVFK